MFKRKIKQFICALLVVSLLLVNKGMYTGCEVHAKTGTTTYENKEDGFAEAVADYYKNGEIDTQRDFEVNPDEYYERSIVTDTYRENNGGVDQVKEYVAKSACLWEKKAYPGGLMSCKYIGCGSVWIGTQEWEYDIIEHTVGSYPYPSFTANLYAVNVRPTNSTIEGNITLPAYLEATIDGEKQLLKCVELGDGAFLQNEKITEVNIPDTYQRICAYAFTGCKNLKEIHFVTTEPLASSQGNAIDAYTVDETVSGEQNLDNSDLHFLGTGAFAGCKSLKSVELPTKLTEGYRELTWDQEEQKNVDRGYKTCHTDSNPSYQVLNENAYEIGQTYTQPHFMGQGVFRDCYGLEKVTIDGINPYIPANTYAGCAGIKKINITDTVENIYFGAASFAGADGNGTASSLTELNLDGSNLKNVIIGAYAFKNCKSLKKVNITANLNQQTDICNSVQGSRLFNENAFENAFAYDIDKPSSFTYAPKDSSEFVIPEGFFKNSNVQEINFGGQFSKIEVNRLAFMRCPCSKIKLVADTVELNTGSLYSLGKKDVDVDVDVAVTIQGTEIRYYGEPLANPQELVTISSTKNQNLKKICFDSARVDFQSEEKVNVGIGKSVDLWPSFYGAPSDLKVVFSEKLSEIYGSIGDNDLAGDDGYTSVSNPGLGDLAFGVGTGGFFFQGNNIDDYNLYFSSGQNKTIAKKFYADGITKEKIEDKQCLQEHIQDYTQIPADQKPVEVIYDGKNEKYNTDYGIKHAELIVRYADNPNKDVTISYDENDENEKNGFKVVTADWENEIKQNQIDCLDISYRGHTKKLRISYVQKRPTSVTATAVTDKSFLAGAKPELEDFKIDAIQYNDETIEECVEDKSNFSVSVPEGVYKQGENTVTITYSDGAGPDVTTTCKVVAEGPKVTSLTASLKDSAKKYYVGDSLQKGDFVIKANYNNGKTDDTYGESGQYQIIPGQLEKAGETYVTLQDENGASTSVKIDVNEVQPVSPLLVTYQKQEVTEGSLLDKGDFVVTLRFNNGKTQVLTADEFRLDYSTIKVGSNTVLVYYQKDGSIYGSITVTGVEKASHTNSETDNHNTNTSNTQTDSNTTATRVPTSTNAVNATNAPNTTATNTAGSTNPSNVTTSESASNTTTVTSLAQLDGNTKRVTIGVGEKIALLYIENVTYTTSNSQILSVNHNIVTGKKVGKASVTLKDTSGNTKTYVINVKKAPKKLMLKVKKTIKDGKKTAKIQVSFPKGSYSYIVKFASSNKKIAVVDKNGVIDAKSKGTCKITVKTYNNKKATIKIKVK